MKKLLVMWLTEKQLARDAVTKTIIIMWRWCKYKDVGHQAVLCLVFGFDIKKYLEENNIPLQALLVLDNASAHLPNLENDILEAFEFINLLYLPPNNTPILQTMD